jgi:hypothetical protein
VSTDLGYQLLPISVMGYYARLGGRMAILTFARLDQSLAHFDGKIKGKHTLGTVVNKDIFVSYKSSDAAFVEKLEVFLFRVRNQRICGPTRSFIAKDPKC